MSTGTINEARLRACVGAFLEIGRACGDDTSELFGAVIARPAERPVARRRSAERQPLTYDDLQRIDRANEKRSRKAAARLARRAS